MATKEQVQNFIETISPLAQKEYQTRNKKLLPSVCIAQACLETGYGTSQLMVKANAFFGIKCGSSWNGKVYNAKTKECYDSKNYVTINDCFRAYDNIADSVKDYYDLICGNSRYQKAIGENDYKKCIQYIKDGGYATSPTYVQNVCKIIETYDLTKYDNLSQISTPKYFKKYKGNSLSFVEALSSLGVNSSFECRKIIAKNNGITNYKGSYAQNIILFNLLKQGKLRKK